MTHVPDAITVASLRTHRLILFVDNAGVAETRSNLSRPNVANLLRTLANNLASADAEATCLDELFNGQPCPAHASPTEHYPTTTADDPIPLRWGLDDVLHGDDDTITVCLSGPDRTPYALELDPDRAQALRTALTPLGNLPAPSNAVSPEEGVEEARKAIQHVLQIFLDRVPRAHLEADVMADSIADAMSDELEDVYEKAGRTLAAEAAIARVLAWCDDLDRAIRLRHMDLDAEHPHAVAVRSVVAQEGPNT